jgi:REP element-mobilizing transposase RayT
MPRRARIDATGALQHVIARGIDRRKIFTDNSDRDNFLDRLDTILSDTHTVCYAWALLPNHFHLLLRTGTVPLSTVMRRLLTGYAVTFNFRHRRHGHLFQNRFKSILCQEDTYLMELVRYIHLNPLRAKIVPSLTDLDQYAYSGHSAILGKHKRAWQDTDYILKFYAKTVIVARRRYREYVNKGIVQGRRPELVGGGLVRSAGGWSALKTMRQLGFQQKADERILGDGDFVSWVLSEANEQLEAKYRLKASGFDFNMVVKRVAELLQIAPDRVMFSGKSRQAVKARSLVCYWASSKLGLSQIHLAQRFGISQPAVSLSVKRGEKLVKEQSMSMVP